MNKLLSVLLQYRLPYPVSRRAGLLALSAAVWLGAAGQLPAAFEENGTGARSVAMAGAFTAVADTSETIFLQPAGLAFLNVPALSLTYGKLLTGLSDGSELNDGAVAFGMSFRRCCGFGFGYKNTGLSTTYREEIATIGGAWRPLPFISAGAAIKHLRLNYGRDNYTAVDPVFASGYEKTGIDLDAGIFLKLSPYFNLAWNRQNLVGVDMGLKEKAAVASADHLGLTYVEDSFTMTVESVKIEDRCRFLSAVEKWFLRKSVALRAGFGWGDRDFRKATAGLGVSFDRFTIDYALEYPLSGIEQTSGTHYVTLSAKFAGRQEKEDGATAASVAIDTVPAATAEPSVADPSSVAGIGGEKETEDIFYGPVSSITCIAVPVSAAESSGTLKAKIADFMVRLTTAPAAKIAAPDKPAAPAVRPKSAAAAAVQTDLVKKKAVRNKEPTVREPQPFGRTREMLTHRTVAGDTLPGLAERYYGKKTLWMKIYNANNDRIEKGALRPGDILIIPLSED
jgi:LysM repeat protein